MKLLLALVFILYGMANSASSVFRSNVKRAVVVARPPPTVVVRPPPTVVVRPGKRGVFEQVAELERIERAVVVAARRPGKRDVSNEQKESESKRAVVVARPPPTVVVRRPPTVVVRPGKRGVFEQFERINRAVVVAARRPGKRDSLTSPSLNAMRIVVSLSTGKIEWSYGLQQRIACNMKQRFGQLIPDDLNIRLNDLRVMDAFEKSVEFLNLMSVKSSFENKFTFLDPLSKEPVLWSIFSKDIAGQLGFFIQDEVCFQAIVSAVKDFKDSPVEFFLL